MLRTIPVELASTSDSQLWHTLALLVRTERARAAPIRHIDVARPPKRIFISATSLVQTGSRVAPGRGVAVRSILQSANTETSVRGITSISVVGDDEGSDGEEAEKR